MNTASDPYRELAELKRGSALFFAFEQARCLVAPDMGGRVFASLCGHSLHRIDLEAARRPDRPFNNFGGANFWPAPEGGRFGFNYRGDEWMVQPAINAEPFRVGAADARAADLQKPVALVNRAGTRVDARMQRQFRLVPAPPEALRGFCLAGFLSYQTTDRFAVTNRVSADAALLAAWTLEQFPGTDQTLSFGVVDRPREALNFDYYEHPGERIAYGPRGFTYRTDSQRKGQIGIRQAAGARMIGWYDLSRRLLCLRENASLPGGVYINIADNEQTGGPFSAADNYSLFNSDPDMGAFELETIGPMRVSGEWLEGSELISLTTFACFETRRDLVRCMDRLLGPVPAA